MMILCVSTPWLLSFGFHGLPLLSMFGLFDERKMKSFSWFMTMDLKSYL